MRRRVLLAGLALPPPAAASDALVALRAGGVVAVLRHAITDRSQTDGGDLNNRAAQRNLSAAGRDQAVRIGRAFVALGVPLGAVLASPVFRARDTADLAFGTQAVVEPRLTADDYIHDPAVLAAHIAWLRARCLRPSSPAATDVLVGHIVPLGMALGRSLGQAEFPEGGLAVFAPGGLLGMIPPEALFAAAGSSGMR